jgi:hypothetical protein
MGLVEKKRRRRKKSLTRGSVLKYKRDSLSTTVRKGMGPGRKRLALKKEVDKESGSEYIAKSADGRLVFEN